MSESGKNVYSVPFKIVLFIVFFVFHFLFSCFIIFSTHFSFFSHIYPFYAVFSLPLCPVLFSSLGFLLSFHSSLPDLKKASMSIQVRALLGRDALGKEVKTGRTRQEKAVQGKIRDGRGTKLWAW